MNVAGSFATNNKTHNRPTSTPLKNGEDYKDNIY